MASWLEINENKQVNFDNFLSYLIPRRSLSSIADNGSATKEVSRPFY
jgi:hypothetical protein